MFGRGKNATGPATQQLREHVDRLPRDPRKWSSKEKDRYQELSRDAAREA